VSREAKLGFEEDETSLACMSGSCVEMTAGVKRRNKKSRRMMNEDERKEMLVGVSFEELQYYSVLVLKYYDSTKTFVRLII
jgi:hypothetical protein